jgi:hypothetical protein
VGSRSRCGEIRGMQLSRTEVEGVLADIERRERVELGTGKNVLGVCFAHLITDVS